MAVRRGNEKMVSSVPCAAVENEHTHCDSKGQERNDPCEAQYVALTWAMKTVSWQVGETWKMRV